MPLLISDFRPPPAAEFDLYPLGQLKPTQATSYNNYGNRIAVGTTDGRIKVYDRAADHTWVLCDTWRAHKGNVIEVPTPMSDPNSADG